MNLNLGCITDVGNYRNKNQDRIMCERRESGEHMLAVACVCDGIGSFEYSEIAAQMMTDGIEEWLKGVVKYYPDVMNKQALVEDLEVTIQELNELICEYSETNQIRIGCTMSLILIVDCEYYIFHVGDSRIYCLQNTMFQLTQDEVILRKVNDVEKTFLANYIGKDRALCISRRQGYANEQDIFILGSDGLYKKLIVDDFMILKDAKTDSQVDAMCRELVRLAMSRDEKDNISCAVLKVNKIRG